MSPFSLPVLGGAAIVSSPALWQALVVGSTTTQVALTRYLVSVVVCWSVMAFVAMLVGPPQTAEPVAAESAETDLEQMATNVESDQRVSQ